MNFRDLVEDPAQRVKIPVSGRNRARISVP